MMHDFGRIAAGRVGGRRRARGFEVYVGGGLGTVPHQAKLLDEIPPRGGAAAAVAGDRAGLRPPGREAEPQPRPHQVPGPKLGIEEFRRLVDEEREDAPVRRRAGRRTCRRGRLRRDAGPQGGPGVAQRRRPPEGYDEWARTNVYPQQQPGYVVATVALPLGDITSTQTRQLGRHRPPLRRRQRAHNRGAEHRPALGAPRRICRRCTRSCEASTGRARRRHDVDVTACPGTDTCKLGIASSRGLAGELRTRLAAAVRARRCVHDLHIKVSGCFNSCGQHHVADIGFYGNSRNNRGVKVPHFQVVLGGRWRDNAGAYGLAIGAVPVQAHPRGGGRHHHPLRRGARSAARPSRTTSRGLARWSSRRCSPI